MKWRGVVGSREKWIAWGVRQSSCSHLKFSSAEVTKAIWVYIKKKVRRSIFVNAVPELTRRRSRPSNARLCTKANLRRPVGKHNRTSSET